MNRVCIVGLDEEESTVLQRRLDCPVVAHVSLPRIVVDGDILLVERRSGPGYLPVSHVVYHSIFADDLDFLAALALWRGPCLPSARGMMDCRLKLPCLVRALAYTRFGAGPRGFVWPGARFTVDDGAPRVAKWGNWHCGENKALFERTWESDEPCLIEPFWDGEAVRVVIVGRQAWQIRLAGTDWRRSIHDPSAAFMDIDADLLADTEAVRAGFGLEVIANDYVVTADGGRHLLEVNHIPNVDRFPVIREAYRDLVVEWVRREDRAYVDTPPAQT